MKRRALTVVLALVAMMGVQSTMAWGGFGHSSAAYIAEQHLTPKAKAECRKYLGHTLPFYASWMDHWREIGPYKPTTYWHTSRVDKDWKVIYDREQSAIYNVDRIHKEMMNYKNLPDSLIRINLIYLVHMVPDMHCPVHTSFDKKDFPEYRYKITNNGKKYGLHTIGDASPAFRRKGWTIERYSQEIDIIDAKTRKAYMKGTPRKWADDAAKQALRFYPLVPEGTDVAKMSKEDVEKLHELADEMILKGGYRLAALLNKIFK